MPAHPRSNDEHFPLALLTELAVEGTSNLVEAHRTLLDLAKQENEIIFNGVRERVGMSTPAVAITDLMRRGVDTLITMQQDLLTTTSKQALRLLQPDKAQGPRSKQLVEFAREGVETFARAQKTFLGILAQESTKATRGKTEHEGKPAKQKEIVQLAREAGSAFIEAQKRLLDVVGQQMNVNLDVATRGLQKISPADLLPMANMSGEGVRRFVDAETSLITSLIEPKKKGAARAKQAARKQKTVEV